MVEIRTGQNIVNSYPFFEYVSSTPRTYTKLTGFVARGLWVLLAMPTLSEDVESS